MRVADIQLACAQLDCVSRDVRSRERERAVAVAASGVRYCQCGQRLARDHVGSRCGVCERRAIERAAVPPEVPAGFWVTQAFRDAFEAQHIGRVARAYRRHPLHVATYGGDGISQALLGGWLGLTQGQVSRIEIGPPVRNLDTLGHWARVLQIPPEHLWFTPLGGLTDTSAGYGQDLTSSRPLISSPTRGLTAVGELEADPAALSTFDKSDMDRDGGRSRSGHGAVGLLPGSMEAVRADQDRWREVRRYLNHHRSALAEQAVSLYPSEWRIRRTALIAPASWLPSEPVDLADVALTWVDDVQAAQVAGTEPETRGLRPLRAPGHQFDRYTAAVRYLEPPRLFENRPSYRLLDLDWSDGGSAMRFGLGTYFDKLDVCEALGHEMAMAASGHSDAISGRDLPFRSLIGDPFGFRQRTVLPAITTLTLRRGKSGVGFLLHWRDPRKVATATRMYDVIPAGEFQPSSIAPRDLAGDLDIWKNIVRELNEELLGVPEFDGSRSVPIDYSVCRLYQMLTQARAEGRASALCLGVGLDALTLAATILTAVVIDSDIFDDLFGEVVHENSEGVILQGGEGGQGIEFSEANVTRLVEHEPVAAPGAACLELAWMYRTQLLTK